MTFVSKATSSKRYKYLVDTVISESAVQIDTKCSITYNEDEYEVSIEVIVLILYLSV